MLARLHSVYSILTLQTSLEEVICLGEDYLISEAGEDWRTRDLLVWLEQEHPDLLSLPVALVPPDANGDGAVFEVDLAAEPLTNMPLYQNRDPNAPVFQPGDEGSSAAGVALTGMLCYALD